MSLELVFLFIFNSWVSCFTNGEVVGPLIITENGQQVTRYALSTWAETIWTNGSSITMQHNSGVQIASNASQDYSNPYMFVGYKLDVKCFK